MKPDEDNQEAPHDESLSVAYELLARADREPRRSDFLRSASRLLKNALSCDAAEVCVLEEGTAAHGTTTPNPSSQRGEARAVSGGHAQPTDATGDSNERLTEDALCRELLNGSVFSAGPKCTAAGSAWIGSPEEPLTLVDSGGAKRLCSLALSGPHRSLCWVPFALDQKNRGLLVLKSRQPQFFSRERVRSYEPTAQILGAALVHRRTRLALRERVKELTCLYGMARLVARRDISLGGLLQSAVEIFPPAFLHPDIAAARIVLDGESFVSRGFQEGYHQLRADLVIDGVPRGHVEVTYSQERPLLDEGAFLQEERNLIDMVARELALIIDQHETETMRERLQEQLRHADRLATLGQLSAGVAHELNEPLGCILGFAQLAKKDPCVTGQAQQDLDKIVSASLHAREIVQKLMLLARQMPPESRWMSLNTLVEDGLYFLESRCKKSGIELTKELDPELPELRADPGQLYQVLINLAVNAIQAMPRGGRLTIRTFHSDQGVALAVEDTGTGMPEEVRTKVFMPFFTTKDVGKGTGLGLSVVDGIVSSHGGNITVASEVGAGTTFTVHLPLGGASSTEAQPGDHDGWR